MICQYPVPAGCFFSKIKEKCPLFLYRQIAFFRKNEIYNIMGVKSFLKLRIVATIVCLNQYSSMLAQLVASFENKSGITFFEKGLPSLIFNVEKKNQHRWESKMEGLLNELHPATFRLFQQPFDYRQLFFLSQSPMKLLQKQLFPPISHEVVAKTGVVVSQCHRRNDSLTGKAKSSSRGSLDSSRK